MEQPLVSVVVVSYNHAKYIKENLDSIKAQTYPNIELIIADDASKDNSVEVFEAWLSENNYSAKKNFHTQNTGLATTLNECIKMVNGKYVKLIAADDYLHPSCIEKCVEKLENLSDDYGMVFSDTYAVNDNSERQKDIDDYSTLCNIPPEQFAKDLISKGNIIPALTVLMKTKALKETGEYDPKFITDDYFRWLKINERYKIAYIDEKLTYYRLHTHNISKHKGDKIVTETFIFQMMFDKTGIAKQRINNFVWNKFKNDKKIDKDLISAYLKYPFKNKKMAFCLKYGINFKIFNFFLKLKY